jgi:hypothetical protein
MDKTKDIGRPSHSTPSVAKGKNYLLAIGIDDYEPCAKLNNCVADANALIEELTTRYFFEPQYITFLTNKDCTRSNRSLGIVKTLKVKLIP